MKVAVAAPTEMSTFTRYALLGAYRPVGTWVVRRDRGSRPDVRRHEQFVVGLPVGWRLLTGRMREVPCDLFGDEAELDVVILGLPSQ